ncbi:helix-turn-helix domain-containing protein [Ferrimicrobium sp.]|uniref:helix-turn-helix domain-containing protein n=1 Tax=Ferrimicrobium sp. TaxID=2926050 RepID=UPI00345CD87B
MNEAAIMLGVSGSTLYRSIERGDFPVQVYSINGTRRIPRVAILKMIAGELDTGQLP